MELGQPSHRVLEVLKQMIRDHEVQRVVLDRGEVLGAAQNRDRSQGLAVELRIVLPKLGLGQAVDIAHMGAGRDFQGAMWGPNLDALPGEPARQVFSLPAHVHDLKP